MPECRVSAPAGKRGAGNDHPAHGRVQLERGLGRAAPVVLAGLGIAEEGQHAVALDAGNVAAVARNDLAAEAAQLGEHAGVELGLHQLAEAGGFGEVREEDGQVPAPPGDVVGRVFIRSGFFFEGSEHVSGAEGRHAVGARLRWERQDLVPS